MTGAICLDILKVSQCLEGGREFNYDVNFPQDQWAAAMTLRTVLLSIQALLAAPEPDDPQDAVVARQYQENFTIFKATAQHWAASFAGSGYKVCVMRQIIDDKVSVTNTPSSSES